MRAIATLKLRCLCPDEPDDVQIITLREANLAAIGHIWFARGWGESYSDRRWVVKCSKNLVVETWEYWGKNAEETTQSLFWAVDAGGFRLL